VVRATAAVGVGGVLTVFALLLVKGRRGWSGPVVLPVATGAGVHLADVAVLGLWLLAVVALGLLVRDAGRGRGSAG